MFASLLAMSNNETDVKRLPKYVLRKGQDNMSSYAGTIKSNGQHLPDRRHVTALAYDLVGSTQLTFQLDPEDMGSVRRSFHDACTKAVKRYEGYINGYASDGAMAFFGYPSDHEDDAERAVKAGLEIVAACSELNNELGPVGF